MEDRLPCDVLVQSHVLYCVRICVTGLEIIPTKLKSHNFLRQLVTNNTNLGN